MKDGNDTANSSTQVNAIFRCFLSLDFTWNPEDIITRWCTLSVNSVAFIPTMLLNLLIIIAVKQRKKLQTNCNILLSSLAVTDLLVGAVPQPLFITQQGFLRENGSLTEYFCAVNSAYLIITSFASTSSYLHLTVIAWERWIAIKKPFQYKMIVTGALMKKILSVVWIAAFLFISPDLLRLCSLLSKDQHSFLLSILSVPQVVPLPLIVYFYLGINMEIRTRPAILTSHANAMARINHERSVAKTTGLLTAAVLLCYSPMLLTLFGYYWPAVYESTFFLWVVTVFHLNSLLNPLLYCYRNDRLRETVLELLRIRNPSVPYPKPNEVVPRNAWQGNSGSLVAHTNETASHAAAQPRWKSCDNIADLNTIAPLARMPKTQRSQSAPPCLGKGDSIDSDMVQNHSRNAAMQREQCTTTF